MGLGGGGCDLGKGDVDGSAIVIQRGGLQDYAGRPH